MIRSIQLGTVREIVELMKMICMRDRVIGSCLCELIYGLDIMTCYHGGDVDMLPW